MQLIDISANDLVSRLLAAGDRLGLCLLDSCGTMHSGSQFLIAGLSPVQSSELYNSQVTDVLRLMDDVFSGDKAAIFTLSYDFGRKLHGIDDPVPAPAGEPDVFISLFESLLVHDYQSGKTYLSGSEKIAAAVLDVVSSRYNGELGESLVRSTKITSNFSKGEYLAAVEAIKEEIRRGNTYQTNLTQQLTVSQSAPILTQGVFARLRRLQPAPFAAYIKRKDSTVISASPERFFRVTGRNIEASPIKGTRPRGRDQAEDDKLKRELLDSGKDRAENTMIVDLLRNDLGRVCKYGSVNVRELCSLQELPSLFHMMSTITGELRNEVKPSDIIRALFPCGSITGAPKISTMKIIQQIEKIARGLSMGAIGLYIPDEKFGLPGTLDLSVAIRTMVIRDATATFNVGGGIVIDSDPEKEYQESLLKAESLLDSLGCEKSITIDI